MNKGLMHILLSLAAALVLSSCDDMDPASGSQRRRVGHTVAVVAPVGDEFTKKRLERTAAWFLENFREAQLHNATAVDLRLEWYDESSVDLAGLSLDLAGREDVVAVVGTFGNESLSVFAPACQRKGKPLIAPIATSEDVIRRYAVTTSGAKINKDPFLWVLTESDVSFTGLLMSRFSTECRYYGDLVDSPKAAFFSPDDAYGMTFN